MKAIKALWQKYREQGLYLIFGGLTTAIDWAISFGLYYLWSDAMQSLPALVHVADVIAWVAAVLFAFVTNRIFVFESKQKGFLPIARELLTFSGGRIFTLLLQEMIMLAFVTWLGLNVYVFRIIAAVLVIILNSIISKLLVFRRK